MCIVSVETVLPALATLAVFAALLAMLKLLKNRGVAFTPRVFAALGLGIALGVGVQLALGRGSDAAVMALDWIAVVGQGYIALMKMLVMPLVFVAIVGAFTRTKVTENLGRISVVVLAVLLGTVAVAALVGWAGAAFTDLPAPASLRTPDRTPQPPQAPSKTAGSRWPTSRCRRKSSRSSRPTCSPTSPEHVPRPPSPSSSSPPSSAWPTCACATATPAQAAFFQQLVDSLYGIVMRIVAMVLGLAPYGVLALIAHVMASSDYRAVLDLGKFVLVSYAAIAFMFVVHALVLLANRASPRYYLRKAFPVLSFAFVARSSAGALPLNIETQTNALGVDEATANFAASFGMSIGQNGCAGIYPAMLATIIAPTVGIDVFSPAFVAGLVAVVAISSFGVAGVGGGATFASLIVLGTMGLPIEIVGLLASVEPLIDMGRTALNVSDSMVAGVTASNVAGTLDRTVFNDPEARVNSGMHTEL